MLKKINVMVKIEGYSYFLVQFNFMFELESEVLCEDFGEKLKRSKEKIYYWLFNCVIDYNWLYIYWFFI